LLLQRLVGRQWVVEGLMWVYRRKTSMKNADGRGNVLKRVMMMLMLMMWRVLLLKSPTLPGAWKGWVTVILTKTR
jgi:hypothetical protein